MEFVRDTLKFIGAVLLLGLVSITIMRYVGYLKLDVVDLMKINLWGMGVMALIGCLIANSWFKKEPK